MIHKKMQVATLFCKNSNPLSGGTNNMMESPTTSSSSATPASSSATPASSAALSATALLLSSTSHNAQLSPTVATTPTAPAVPVISETITDTTTTSSSSETNERIITETTTMDVVKENTTVLVVNTVIDVVREDNSVELKIIADQNINNIVSNEKEVENKQNEFHSSESLNSIKTESVSNLDIGISTETNNTMNENGSDGDIVEHHIVKNHEIDAVVSSDDLKASFEKNIVKTENEQNIERTPLQITDCDTTDENKCTETVNSFYDGLSLTASSPPSATSPVDMDNKDNSNSLKSFDSGDLQSSIINEKLNDEKELLNSGNDDNAMNVVNNINEKNGVDANCSIALVDDVNNSEKDKFGANTDNSNISNTDDNKLNLNIDIDMDNSNTNNNDSFKNNNLNNNDHSNEICQSAVQYFQNQINKFSPPLGTSASTNTTEPPDLGSHESMADCEDDEFNKL